MSVVVVNWNGGTEVVECIRTVFAQSRPADEVIIVDNASTDGSREAIESTFPTARLVRSETNRGFGGGVNLGVKAATSEWLALLNSDAMADPRWLEEMLHSVRASERFGMGACKIYLDRQGGILDKVGHRIGIDGQNFGCGHGLPDDGRYDERSEVAWPDGCASLWRRDVFNQVGGVDEEFFAYADDADLGIRFRLAGWKCALAPTALVEHHHSQTLGAYSPAKLFLVERNRIWLTFKYFPWHLIALNPLLWAWRAALTTLGGRKDAGPWAKVSAEERSSATRAVLRAQLAGWAGIRSQLRKRGELAKRCGPEWRARMRTILKRDRVPLADLARGEVR
ncbi:MAG: glycosyltransferase family 2 protein [Candidatus Binatia bacterium]|nr:glycosyltransferase family 2 protein [Candidatus Binatia bacterium]